MSPYEQEMNREIDYRLSLLEQEDYDLGKPFNKWDWIAVGAVVIVGLLITLYGLF